MSTKHTKNFNLSQWEPDDKVLREDFNRDNQVIDQTMAKFGNCRAELSTYVGNAEPVKTLTFQKMPMLLVVLGAGMPMVAVRDAPSASLIGVARITPLPFTWKTLPDGTASVTWDYTGGSFADAGANAAGVTYYVFALFDAEE